MSPRKEELWKRETSMFTGDLHIWSATQNFHRDIAASYSLNLISHWSYYLWAGLY